MNVTILIFLLVLMDQALSNTPYCDFGYPRNNHRSVTNHLYACRIFIDGEMTTSNELLATHDLYPNKKNKDVAVLSVAERARKSINVFPSVYCDTFMKLKIVDMSDAKIETVLPDSLKNCKELVILIFYMNEIQLIYENLLINNPRLREVHISYNNITSLPENLFIKQRNLKALELSANYINFLPGKIFESQMNLAKLKLDSNSLKTLNPNWFKSLKNLKLLDLSVNKIEDLPNKIFDPLKRLIVLRLHSNNIKFIKYDSFGRHPDLHEITLRKNELFGIDQEFIKNIPIRKLNMKGNICSKEKFIRREEMDEKLQLCYEYFSISDFKLELTTTTTNTPKGSRKPTTRTKSTTTTPRIITTSPTSIPNPKSECGNRPAGTPLIIEGEDFDPGTYPWMAVLITNDSHVHCGGVLISNRKVLTAAHCILTKSLKNYEDELRVVLGSHDLGSNFEVSRVTAEIEKIHVHENWNPTRSKYESDIAVIVLKNEAEFDDRVQPICLPNKIVERENIGTVIGYGKTKATNIFSKIPKKAQAPIHKLDACLRNYPELQNIASKNTFCGGYGNGTGACTGDSGGGLFVSYENVFYLRGLVSSSFSHATLGCDVKKYSVYTNVSPFIQWINSIKVKKISSRMGDEDVENQLWETEIDYSDVNELESDTNLDSDEEYEETTYEPGRIWSS